jgi:23S rRNA (uracil1939-C5)-methyltransferase
LAAAEVLLLDPPREGLRTFSAFLQRAPALRHILYVSCDVATCARDIEVAIGHGFALNSVQPLDLFPHTPHVELLCYLERDTP